MLFLDLYSGSGAIGIEALSRGAAQAYFVENNRKAIECIKDNLQFTGRKCRGFTDVCESAINELNNLNIRFDFVF
ncbi:MAG: RsmD family RNA methyltransferase [Eubacterium ventriosum]